MRVAIIALALVTAASAAPKGDRPTTTLLESSTTTTSLAEETTTTSRPEETTTTSLPEETTTTIETTTTTSTTSSTTSTTLPGLPCAAGDLSACDDGNPCTLDFCDPVASRCVYTLLDNVPCADEGVFCTVDVCVGGVCQHAPADFRCDLGECVVRGCRPNDPAKDRRGCVLLSGRQPEGQPCTDDGFTCTDDLCLNGSCLHVPVDSRCEQVDACRASACLPQQPDRDEAGCSAGAPRGEGEQCSEDADPCTVDVCRTGACAHETSVDVQACFPLQEVFRRAIALANLTRELTDVLVTASPDRFATSLLTLGRIQSDLDGAIAVLAGRDSLELSPMGTDSTPGDTPPSERVRTAFTMVLRTPAQVSAFLQSLAEARFRAALGAQSARRVRRRGRLLLRNTKSLRGDLRHLQRH